jgi:hypothetical protein
MNGHIMIPRGFLSGPAFAGSPAHVASFLWLVENAVYERRCVRGVWLERGQLRASTRFMASAWGVDPHTVRRHLDRFVRARLIAAPDTASGETLITIREYELFQGRSVEAAPARDATRPKLNKEESSSSLSDESSVSVTRARDPNSIPEKEKEPSASPIELDREYDAIYPHFPRKQAEAAGRREYHRQRRTVERETIANGVMLLAARVTDTNRRFIPRFDKWLKDGCWTDDQLSFMMTIKGGKANGPTPTAEHPEDSRLRMRLKIFRERGTWYPEFGPRPDADERAA